MEGAGNAMRENDQRKWATGEREASQEWQSGENRAGREWQEGENSKNRDWQSGENRMDRDWRSQESERDRNWREGESAKDRDWRTSEREDTQGWQSGENRRREEHETSEREGRQEWQSGESELERQWRSWNEEANREEARRRQSSDQDFRSRESQLGREHESGMQGNMFKHQDEQQARQFQQQEKMARLNAELRGYGTQGAGYGLNAAGGSVNVTVNNSSAGGPGFSEGTFNAGTSGLGYGPPRAQAKMWTSKGSNTTFGSQPGTSVNMTGVDVPIQPHEIRGTGAARSIPQKASDQWLNRNVLKASRTPMASGIKPVTPKTTAIQTGGARAATAALGPEGAAVGLIAGKIDEEIQGEKAMGRGISSMMGKLF